MPQSPRLPHRSLPLQPSSGSSQAWHLSSQHAVYADEPEEEVLVANTAQDMLSSPRPSPTFRPSTQRTTYPAAPHTQEDPERCASPASTCKATSASPEPTP